MSQPELGDDNITEQSSEGRQYLRPSSQASEDTPTGLAVLPPVGHELHLIDQVMGRQTRSQKSASSSQVASQIKTPSATTTPEPPQRQITSPAPEERSTIEVANSSSESEEGSEEESEEETKEDQHSKKAEEKQPEPPVNITVSAPVTTQAPQKAPPQPAKTSSATGSLPRSRTQESDQSTTSKRTTQSNPQPEQSSKPKPPPAEPAVPTKQPKDGKPSPPEDPEDPESTMASSSSMPDVKGFKPAPPKPYDGSEDVSGFLVQARVHLTWYKGTLKNEPQKVLAISQYLAGRVLQWFEPFLKDYMDNYPGTSKETTNYIFEKYSQFEEKLRARFGDADKAQQAEKQLHRLRQTKSAAEYAVEFQRLAAQSGLLDAALFTPFYNGLKTQVKDDLYKVSRPEKFDEYVNTAILIDRRSFERFLEKKGSSKPKEGKGSRAQKSEGQKEVNATSKTQTKDKSKIECYNCGKKGHYKSECRSPRKKRDSRKGGIPQPQKKVRLTEH